MREGPSTHDGEDGGDIGGGRGGPHYGGPQWGAGHHLRGLTSSIHYVMGRIDSLPTATPVEAPCAYRVTQPNGVRLYVTHWLARPPASDNPFNPYLANRITFEERVGSTTGPLINTGVLNTVGYTTSSSIPVLEVRLGDAHDVIPGYPNVAGHYWTRRYHYFTQDLLWELRSIYPKPDVANLQLPDLATERRATPPSWNLQRVETTKEYNFMGNPLEQSVVESSRNASTNAWTTSPAKAVSYAYWGADKYFQQRAVRSKKDASNYRYSLTDYYDANAAQGMKGQEKINYDAKYATYSLGTNWKYDIQPASGSIPVAEFPLAGAGMPAAYDVKGRPIRLLKLSRVVSGLPTYTETRTSYGADTDGSWGQIGSVTEAFGTSDVRTTYTLAYTPDGKPCKVQDANGRIVETDFGLDGEINLIKRIDSGLNQTLASYSYGTSGAINGQLSVVTDHLSGTIQNISYYVSGSAIGQVSQIDQNSSGLASYTAAYSYNPAGERAGATYTTPNGTWQWSYNDYIRLGDPISGRRSFQTLRRVDSTTSMGTSEEFHYVYDSNGRLSNAMFGLSPQTGTGAPVSAPFYTSSYPAVTRYQACYETDPAGRSLAVYHRWDQWSGSTYIGAPVLGNESQYDLVKGLKTQSQILVPNIAGTSWTVAGTESYGYEPERSFLTSVDYDASGPLAPQTWSYDASQNRSDSGYIYNHLNQLTSSSAGVNAFDAVGNQISKGSGTTYSWDAVNRLTSSTVGAVNTSYSYRADGLRIRKVSGAASTLYRHDGQNTIQEVEATGTTVSAVTDYALGGRGVDALFHSTSSGSQVRYPLYDTHGDLVGTVAKSGPSSLGDRKQYDVWGMVRIGSGAGWPTTRYGASLGHHQDDETGLLYLKARYYDPAIGRFLSEDPSHDGSNWYTYCRNNPVNGVDPDGKEFNDASYWTVVGCGLLVGAGILLLIGGVYAAMRAVGPGERLTAIKIAVRGLGMTAVGMAGPGSLASLEHTELSIATAVFGTGLSGTLGLLTLITVITILEGAEMGGKTTASTAVAAAAVYSLLLLGCLKSMEFE